MSNAWVQTVSGMDVDLLEPTPDQILLGDIAHSLARLARFNGHTIGDLPWSVAQHSLLVESLMPPESTPHDRMVALLHDAHEAYIGDLVSPLFIAMDSIPRINAVPSPSTYLKNIASALDTAIWKAFGLDPNATCLAAVKKADMLALRVERDLLMAPSRRAWMPLPDAPDPMPVLRPCYTPVVAMQRFLDRFHLLQMARHNIDSARFDMNQAKANTGN